MSTTHTTPAALTDVSEFITDLEAGVFERKLAKALSMVAASACDAKKNGEVHVKFTFKPLAGTSQVTVQHQLKFVRPTAGGKATEDDKQDTVLHVGTNGRLSLIPENQLAMFDTKAPAAGVKA